MLRSELYELEKCIDSILHEDRIVTEASYLEMVGKQVGTVQAICSDLQKKWIQELLSNTKEQVIKRYVQYHQAGIIRLSNKVSMAIPVLNSTTEGNLELQKAFTSINLELEKLLEFLRRQFYQYFDIDHKSTTYHCQLINLKISAFEPEMRSYNESVIDKALIACVLSSVREVMDEGELSGISYRQSDQCLNLVRMTSQLLVYGNASTPSLMRALYHQNMNSLYFYNWYQEFITGQAAQKNNSQERDNFIAEQIKFLTGIFVPPDKALQPELPSADVLFIPWLREQTRNGNSRTRIEKQAFQLPLNLSVPQFALFIRIFHKTGCVPVENVALITRFFTEHFTTKKQPHISRKSFGRAFYSLDQSAAAVVRDYLQKMLNYLNKTYFP